jgi:hypothetical protein
MRHSLGLRSNLSVRPASDRPANPTIGTHSQRRRFIRDGEVPVTVLRRHQQSDGDPGANQLIAARQAVQSEAVARERAERSLAEVQVVIRDLQTKLAHERLAKEEALENFPTTGDRDADGCAGSANSGGRTGRRASGSAQSRGCACRGAGCPPGGRGAIAACDSRPESAAASQSPCEAAGGDKPTPSRRGHRLDASGL